MTFLNVTEIESALKGLNKTYPALTQLLPLPNITYEQSNSQQSNCRALLIRGNPSFHCRPALVFVSGVHAREWGGPDILVNLAADLLEAYTGHAGLAYGAKTFTAAEIRAIVNRTDVVIFPDINPDGRAYSMGGAPGPGQAMWRKNRNPASGGGSTGDAGVDVNRNYDFLWDFQTKFSPSAAGTVGSADPGKEGFHGTGPFSEAETRNVQWLVDRFPRARYFVDVHSYGGDVLHPWGDDENQSTDPSKSFKNTTWDGKRGLSGDAYGEYIPAARLAELKAAASVMRDGINAVRNQGYVSKQGFWLWPTTYPTSGASEDWAFAREFLNPKKGKLSGFVIEFNKVKTFFPTWAEMEKIILDVDAGLLSLCEYATPSSIQAFWCWFRPPLHRITDLYLRFWRKLFPPEIWGPYGPWTRIARRIERVIERLSSRRGG